MQVIHKMHVVTMVKVKMSFSVSRFSVTVEKYPHIYFQLSTLSTDYQL